MGDYHIPLIKRQQQLKKKRKKLFDEPFWVEVGVWGAFAKSRFKILVYLLVDSNDMHLK